MRLFGKLKRLKETIRRLVHKRRGVSAISNQASADPQSSDIPPEEAQSFCSNLQEEANAKDAVEEQIEKNEQEIAEFERQLAEYEKELAEHEQKLAEHQKLIEEHRLELASKQQMKSELEFLSNYQSEHQQNPNNFLICEETFIDSWPIRSFWGGRFLVIVDNHDADKVTHSLKVYDTFQGVSRSFAIQELNRIWAIYALKEPYLLLWEYKGFDIYLRLAMLDFERGCLQIIQSFEFYNYFWVVLNSSNSSKFLLNKSKSIYKCSLVYNKVYGGRIEVDENPVFESHNFYGSCSYFDEQLCKLDFNITQSNQFKTYNLTQVKMLCYDWEKNTSSTYDLDNTPDILHCCHIPELFDSAWMRDTVFFTFRLKLLNKDGVIFTNPQTRSWKILDFGMIDLRIGFLQFVGGETLMLSTGERKDDRYELKFYKYQMRKPDSLRNMAWIALVKLFKEAKAENPYEEAREYLPLNTGLQPYIMTTFSTSTDSSMVSDN